MNDIENGILYFNRIFCDAYSHHCCNVVVRSLYEALLRLLCLCIHLVVTQKPFWAYLRFIECRQKQLFEDGNVPILPSETQITLFDFILVWCGVAFFTHSHFRFVWCLLCLVICIRIYPSVIHFRVLFSNSISK